MPKFKEVKPLITAAGMGDAAQVRRLLASDPRLATDRRPALEAAKKGRAEVLGILLDASNGDVDPPLIHLAIRPEAHSVMEVPSPEQRSCVELLLERGADLEKRGGWPPVRPLSLAAMAGCREIVDLLIRSGAQISFYEAACLGLLSEVEEALAQSPDSVQEIDPSGLAVLHFCAASHLGSFEPATALALAEIATLLIEAGADPNQEAEVDDHGLAPLYWACSSHCVPVIQALLEGGADPTTGLSASLWNGSEDIASLLLDHGADIDAPVEDGPLLYNLAHWGQLKKATWLLKRGANPNLSGPKGRVPLHAAASRGSIKFARSLMEHGAKLNIQDDEGMTPLMLAKSRKKEDMVQLLNTSSSAGS